MGAQVGQTVLGYALAAGLMTCLLLGAGHASFRRRYVMVLGAAVLCWVVGNYPEVVWWGHPAGFAACKLMDYLVGWALAGIPLARITGECPTS